ncbi:hypothetical protein G9272_28965 [Streptomyces asoensis]|uniref:DUF6542 domain-containing protein n=2 Tax=Streptomyces asoensis TaxID=249586 RepID=A0A6M4WVZ9_9ACTN|nr:DUF6542 domain-containing protein [Streptomyces asoensis]QJT03821.1 hypothetical protein G9272_28965 [Streptomyces asoensis]
MEQHRTRPPAQGTRRDTPPLPPLPPQGGREASREPGRESDRKQPRPAGGPARAGAPRSGGPRPASTGRRPAPPLERTVRTVRRMPNPRLTGLGGGLFSGVLMFVIGCLDELLFGASLTVYSVLFLPVCLLTALWVRGGDLLSAPVVAPIAFAVGLLPLSEGGNGIGARLMGLVTALATQVGWLYAGTLVAGAVILARGLRRAAARRQTANRR